MKIDTIILFRKSLIALEFGFRCNLKHPSLRTCCSQYLSIISHVYSLICTNAWWVYSHTTVAWNPKKSPGRRKTYFIIFQTFMFGFQVLSLVIYSRLMEKHEKNSELAISSKNVRTTHLVKFETNTPCFHQVAQFRFLLSILCSYSSNEM